MDASKENDKRIHSCDGPAGCKYAAQISRAASDESLKKVFYLMGVDVDDAKSVEAFREDLRFGGKLRKIAERSIIAFIGVVATAVAVFIIEAVRARL